MLHESDIRPDHLRAAQMERFDADIRRLLSRRREFVAVPCPACGSTRSTVAFEKYEFTYQRCADCETVYVSPRPTPEVLEFYYRNSENYQYWNTHIFPASEAVRRERIFRPRAERVAALCAKHGVGRQRLLEVGAGFGTFCEEIRRLGVFDRITAVEPTPDLAESCRRRGLDVIERPIERLPIDPGTVDVIVSFEVIEHLFDPRAFLMACRALLAGGGLLVLTCPNVKGFDVALLGAASDTFDVEHLNYFHPQSLGRLATDCGFVVAETLTPGELDVDLARKKILAGTVSIDVNPFLQRVLIDEYDRLGPPFQRFLAEQGLSSHMWLVARTPRS